jgi:hypothetical protein
MAFSEFELKKIEKAAEAFLKVRRPPAEIRKQLDIAWGLDGQSLFIFEIRPLWNDPSTYEEYPFAKATFVKAKGIWKIYWLRQNLKWNSYDPTSQVKSIEAVFHTVNNDEYGCFFG